MLNKEVVYSLKEIYEPHIKILDKADEMLVRQIKNCINWDYILPKHKKLILDSFKIHA